jgi:hypothetical protein
VIRVDANASQQVRVLDHFLGGEHAISYMGELTPVRTAHYQLAATAAM